MSLETYCGIWRQNSNRNTLVAKRWPGRARVWDSYAPRFAELKPALEGR